MLNIIQFGDLNANWNFPTKIIEWWNVSRFRQNEIFVLIHRFGRCSIRKIISSELHHTSVPRTIKILSMKTVVLKVVSDFLVLGLVRYKICKIYSHSMSLLYESWYTRTSREDALSNREYRGLKYGISNIKRKLQERTIGRQDDATPTKWTAHAERKNVG